MFSLLKKALEVFLGWDIFLLVTYLTLLSFSLFHLLQFRGMFPFPKKLGFRPPWT